MHFLGDIKEECEICHGKKYSEEVLKYKYMEKNIFEILEMTIDEAIYFFKVESVKEKLNILKNVGLRIFEIRTDIRYFIWWRSKKS